MATASGSSAAFEDAAYYDALIDWPKRLAREEPFFKKLFEPIGVRRLLDAACGTGRHAAMFHAWGIEVEATDLSAGMIELGRRMYGELPTLRWVQRSFTEPTASPGTFDAAVCLGNSLGLAQEQADRDRACASLWDALRGGGLLIIQVLNLWHLPDGPTQWQKYVRVERGGRDHVLLKALHRTGDRGHVDLVDLHLLPEGGIAHRIEPACFAGIEAEQLCGRLRELGAERITCYGGYDGSPYARTTSADLIVVAHKPTSS